LKVGKKKKSDGRLLPAAGVRKRYQQTRGRRSLLGGQRMSGSILETTEDAALGGELDEKPCGSRHDLLGKKRETNRTRGVDFHSSKVEKSSSNGESRRGHGRLQTRTPIYSTASARGGTEEENAQLRDLKNSERDNSDVK